jgi:O-antigen ligase
MLITAVLAWGVLSFGAVYPWGYIPLLLAATVWAGVSCAARGLGHRPLALAAALLVASGALQLVSIPSSTVAWISPGGDALLRQQSPTYFVFAGWHALSIDPHQTFAAVLLIAVLMLFAMALRSALSAEGCGGWATVIARDVLILGTLVAVLGLVQAATFNGKLYWFWTPIGRASNAFGPFVNRNHFAGWMLLAVCLGAGYFGAAAARIQLDRSADFRKRVLWLSSPEAGRLACTAAALLTMSVALVWTLSRSGIIGFAVAAIVFCGGALARGRARAVPIAGTIVFVCAAGLFWRGPQALVSWYGRTGTLDWRLSLWRDSIAPLKDFWIVGSGLNTYDRVMLSYPLSDPSLNPVNAHNDYLQLGIEGGLLVAIPVLILVAVLLYEIYCRFREPQTPETYWVRLGSTAGLTGIAIQELSDFSLRIPGVAILFVTALAIARHQPHDCPARRSHGRMTKSQL